MFKFFERLPVEILLDVFARLPLKDQAALAQTEKRLNNISQNPRLELLNKKLLNAIRAFNLKVFYSYEAKRETHWRIEYEKIYTDSIIKRSNMEIDDNLSCIINLLSKKADPNSSQFLHEAVFLYFIYKDLVLSQSEYHKYHDNTQPDNQLKLIHLLLEYNANLTIYKHPDSVSKYVLVSLSCFNNFWKQLRFEKRLHPKQMDGLSPVDYAAKFQDQYPEMYKLLKSHQEQVILNGISAVVQQFKLFTPSVPTPRLQHHTKLIKEKKSSPENFKRRCNIM